MNNYMVTLENGAEEPFDQIGDNVIKVRAFDKDGLEISPNSRVQIDFSKNALLGFATELIRLAYQFQDGYHTHLHPAVENLLCENLGVYLAPDSSELIINCADTKPIEKHLKVT